MEVEKEVAVWNRIVRETLSVKQHLSKEEGKKSTQEILLSNHMHFLLYNSTRRGAEVQERNVTL